MKARKTIYDTTIKVRVSKAQKAQLADKARALGQTLSEFLRDRALGYRVTQTPDDKERIRQLARIGSNINQIARWANTHKSSAEAVDVILALAGIEEALQSLAKESMPEDSHVHESL